MLPDLYGWCVSDNITVEQKFTPHAFTYCGVHSHFNLYPASFEVILKANLNFKENARFDVSVSVISRNIIINEEISVFFNLNSLFVHNILANDIKIILLKSRLRNTMLFC